MARYSNISNYARRLIAQRTQKSQKKGGSAKLAAYVPPIGADAIKSIPPHARAALLQHIDTALARLGAPPNG